MNMLRKTIRNIILESQLPKFPFYNRRPTPGPTPNDLQQIPEDIKSGKWTKDQKMVWGILNKRPDLIKRFSDEWGTYDANSASRDEQTIPFDEEFGNPNQKHMQWAQYLRITLRRLWEDRVINSIQRNSWWNPEDIEHQNVRCFHYPQLFRKGRPPQEGIDQFEEYIRKFQTGSVPDLSVEGYLVPPPAGIVRGSLSIELKKRKIVWAGISDQWTEFLSLASAEMIEKYPEGIKKHPNTRIDPSDVLFDPAQITEGVRTITELIISDWDLHPNHIIIYYSYWLPNKPADMKEQLENLGIKYFGSPYIVIELE